MLSQRSAHDPRPNALTLALDGARARGGEVLDLTVSNPTGAGIPYAGEAIVRAFADPHILAYAPEPFGLRSAREAVACDLRAAGASVEPDHILLTASTSEAYSFLFKLLADPGEAILGGPARFTKG